MASILRGLNAISARIARVLTVISLVVTALIIPAEVAGRYLLGSVPAWSGEAAVFSLVWLSMMGAAAGFDRGYTIALTVVRDRLPPAWSRPTRLFAETFLLVFLAVLTCYGAEQTLWNWRQTSPAMGIPMAVPYAALPVGFAMMLLSLAEGIITSRAPGEGRNR